MSYENLKKNDRFNKILYLLVFEQMKEKEIVQNNQTKNTRLIYSLGEY